MSRLILHIGMPKTGTSSLQETLFNLGGVGELRYANLGVVNHGGVITSFFADDPHAWRGHRVAGRSPEEIKSYNQQTLTRLEAVCEAHGQQIISGEDIWHMSQTALIKLRDFFAKHFERIEVVGYARPPASFMASAFQQLVKNHGLARLRVEAYYPRYREKFEKFDRVFGRENVTLRLFDPGHLVGGDAVVDFCNLLGESISPEKIQRVNESLSLEATAVLFAYRREGPQYELYRGKARDNNALVASLVCFGAGKLRFADSLVAPVLEKNHDDIAWMEERLGQRIIDKGLNDKEAIASEAQLLEVASSQFDALQAYVNKQAEQAEPTPEQLARWIEKLRTAISGRNSKGLVPAYGSQSFFTDEQLGLLEDDKLPPVIALRELALAFERHGRKDEASSVIQAAVTLRPDAKGLLALQRRMNVELGVKLSKSDGEVRLGKDKGNKLTRHFLQHLSSSERVNTLYEALGEELQEDFFKFFFNLRRFYFDDWESAVLRFFKEDPSSAMCIRLLAFHYARKGDPKMSNFYLKQLFDIQGNKPNDSVRHFFRNQIVAGSVGEELGEGSINWDAVEPFFKNTLSASSYAFQSRVAANRGSEVELSCRKELEDGFRSEVVKARELLEETRDVSARRDWSVVLEMIKGARTIAVVGKGNSAKGLGLGQTIDSHDLVLRVNHKGSYDSADDYGAKTSVVFHGGHLRKSYQELGEAGSTPAVLLSGFPSYVERRGSVVMPNEHRLEYFVDSIGYKRATTGLRLLIALSLLLELRADVEINAFGFDFYTCPAPGQGGVDEVRNSAAVPHEIDYEKWFAHEFLPLLTALRHKTISLTEYVT